MSLTISRSDIANAELIVIVNQDGGFQVKTELSGPEAADLLYGIADQINRQR